MPATLRVVLDQVTTPVDPQLALVQRELARALVQTAPTGCVVEGIAPSGDEDPAAVVDGLVGVHRLGFGRRELAAAWQFGVAPGVGGGMIHAASLLAPLTRHDRVNDRDQTVVTLWDLDAWEHPERSSKASVLWHRAMLKRADRHADAIVVSSHAMAARVADLTRAGSRIRVIEGSAPSGFAVPTDAVGRLRTLGVEEGAIVVVDGPGVDVATAAVAAAAPNASTFVLDARLDDADRAAVIGSARALVTGDATLAFPWRAVEALALGVPVVAAASEVHREVCGDGAALGDGVDGLGDALTRTLADAARARVRSADRGRGYSWRAAAERVWQLHADL